MNINSNGQNVIPVVKTVPVSISGTYLVTATSLIILDTNDYVNCIVTSAGGANGHLFGTAGPATIPQYATITVTDRVDIGAGDQIQLSCGDYNNDIHTISFNAGISAILLNSVQSSSIHYTSRPPLPKALPHK